MVKELAPLLAASVNAAMSGGSGALVAAAVPRSSSSSSSRVEDAQVMLHHADWRGEPATMANRTLAGDRVVRALGGRTRGGHSFGQNKEKLSVPGRGFCFFR